MVKASDFKDVELPRRREELPELTVRLFISVNKDAAAHCRDLDAVATALSLRYGYPIWSELTPDSVSWEKIYCKKVLDAAWRVVKQEKNHGKA